jgi:DNA-binding response OmpR family regulator
VWGHDFYNQSNVVDVYVGYLRRKIDDGHAMPLIHTVRGVGYKLSAKN